MRQGGLGDRLRSLGFQADVGALLGAVDAVADGREAVVNFALPIADWVYPVWGLVAAAIVLVIATSAPNARQVRTIAEEVEEKVVAADNEHPYMTAFKKQRYGGRSIAVELVNQGWSMKQMHRLIVTSDAYRRASAADPALVAASMARAADAAKSRSDSTRTAKSQAISARIPDVSAPSSTRIAFQNSSEPAAAIPIASSTLAQAASSTIR